MKNALNSVKMVAPTTNSFDLSHDIKLSMQMGDLVPVLAMECIPGDRVRLGCENLIRLAPMLAPMMHRVDVRVEYFFCPNRLIWENWETWITNGGSDSVQIDPLPAHPFVQYRDVSGIGTIGYNKLLDYMGLPDPNQCVDPTEPEKISVLAFAAYQKINNDYYRDENLVAEEPTAFNCLDGDNVAQVEMFKLRKRAWEADYFTKALPFAQKGESVDVPLGDVMLKDPVAPFQANILRLASDHTGNPGIEALESDTGELKGVTSGNRLVIDPNLLWEVAPTTINDLRLAYRLQEWLEKNARGGTRYSELIRSHFNVTPQDSRLQRPEYIVGIKHPIKISEVLNTTGTVEAPQGAMAGHGISYSEGNYGKYFCQEHGYIIGIMSVMPKTGYQQGIPKHFLKFTDPTQLAWPTFGNLGEQPILKKEIMAFQGGDGEQTFGYTPRYMEYKTLENRVCGQFRTTLDFWTMTRIFDPLSPPLLNQAFIEADPTQRIFAVTDPDIDQLYCQCYHHINVVRALPFYGTPTF